MSYILYLVVIYYVLGLYFYPACLPKNTGYYTTRIWAIPLRFGFSRGFIPFLYRVWELVFRALLLQSHNPLSTTISCTGIWAHTLFRPISRISLYYYLYILYYILWYPHLLPLRPSPKPYILYIRLYFHTTSRLLQYLVSSPISTHYISYNPISRTCIISPTISWIIAVCTYFAPCPFGPCVSTTRGTATIPVRAARFAFSQRFRSTGNFILADPVSCHLANFGISCVCIAVLTTISCTFPADPIFMQFAQPNILYICNYFRHKILRPNEQR